MSALRPVFLALSILLVAPAMVHASEITLIPAVKLQIGDQDNNGNYWDGEHWHDRSSWERDYEWRDKHWHKRDKHHEKHDKHDKHGEHGHHGDDDSQD